MHSAFLYHAIKAGMDLGIVNAGLLEVYEEFPKTARTRRRRVAQPPARRNRAPDQIRRVGQKKDKVEAVEDEWRKGTVEERLSHAS